MPCCCCCCCCVCCCCCCCCCCCLCGHSVALLLCFSAALLLCCSVVALLLFCCCSAVALLLLCCFSAAALPLLCCCACNSLFAFTLSASLRFTSIKSLFKSLTSLSSSFTRSLDILSRSFASRSFDSIHLILSLSSRIIESNLLRTLCVSLSFWWDSSRASLSLIGFTCAPSSTVLAPSAFAVFAPTFQSRSIFSWSCLSMIARLSFFHISSTRASFEAGSFALSGSLAGAGSSTILGSFAGGSLAQFASFGSSVSTSLGLIVTAHVCRSSISCKAPYSNPSSRLGFGILSDFRISLLGGGESIKTSIFSLLSAIGRFLLSSSIASLRWPGHACPSSCCCRSQHVWQRLNLHRNVTCPLQAHILVHGLLSQ